MELTMFGNDANGDLMKIHGTDSRTGPWEHHAFQPYPLPAVSPALGQRTYRAVADARAALAALDSTSRRLPDPTLFRMPTLRREAQATSSLEGTYAPLPDVLAADEDAPRSVDLREILNYVRMAEHGYAAVSEGRPLTVSLVEDLQAILVRGTPSAAQSPGRVRQEQVVIGRRPEAGVDELPIRAARYVPPPPGDDLLNDLRGLISWMTTDATDEIDPVVACAMAHYQFESLHPFHDGNGRVGRLLVVMQLFLTGLLQEPTLTISPWFESRRGAYYDHLFAVSTSSDWDGFVHFFARGLEASASSTHEQMLALVTVQQQLRDIVRVSSLRADSALLLVDFAVANPSFTIRRAADAIGVSVGRASGLVKQLTRENVLAELGDSNYRRRYHAPAVHDVLLRSPR